MEGVQTLRTLRLSNAILGRRKSIHRLRHHLVGAQDLLPSKTSLRNRDVAGQVGAAPNSELFRGTVIKLEEVGSGLLRMVSLRPEPRDDVKFLPRTGYPEGWLLSGKLSHVLEPSNKNLEFVFDPSTERFRIPDILFLGLMHEFAGSQYEVSASKTVKLQCMIDFSLNLWLEDIVVTLLGAICSRPGEPIVRDSARLEFRLSRFPTILR